MQRRFFLPLLVVSATVCGGCGYTVKVEGLEKPSENLAKASETFGKGLDPVRIDDVRKDQQYIAKLERENEELRKAVQGGSDASTTLENLKGAHEQITKATVEIAVYDDDKECGEAVVEIKVGKKTYRWGYGAGEDWDDPLTKSFTKENDPLPIVLDGPLSCYGNLEERQGQVRIDAGLDWKVTLTTNKGNTITFTGRHYYRTGAGDTSTELTRKPES